MPSPNHLRILCLSVYSLVHIIKCVDSKISTESTDTINNRCQIAALYVKSKANKLSSPGVQRGGGGVGGHGARGRGGEGARAGGRGEVGHQQAGRVVAVGGRHGAGRV